jgi:two-component system, cell cycle response regulator
VLLLDAAPDNCGLAGSIASHLGYDVTTASTPAQAEACAGQPFDLLLCDLDGPGSHTDALLDAAARHWPGLPMVAIRAADSDAVAPAITARRPAPILLAHPLEPQQLATALAAALPAPPH